jgi:hypothetical protein
MEVFTIGEDDCWRETVAKPPCPFLVGRTATFFKGSLIWTVDVDSPPYGDTLYDDDGNAVMFVRFSLEDESFNSIAAPRWYHGSGYERFRLAELHGELAMACPNKNSVEVWICEDVDSVNPPHWVERHVLDFPYRSRNTHLVAAFDGGIVFQDESDSLFQTCQGSIHMVGMNTLKFSDTHTDMLGECLDITFHGFDVIPYIPTLVPI